MPMRRCSGGTTPCGEDSSRAADVDAALVRRQETGEQRATSWSCRSPTGPSSVMNGVVADLQVEARDRSTFALGAITLGDALDTDRGHYVGTPALSLSDWPPSLLASQIAEPMITMLTMASAATGSV